MKNCFFLGDTLFTAFVIGLVICLAMYLNLRRDLTEGMSPGADLLRFQLDMFAAVVALMFAGGAIALFKFSC